MIAIVSIDDHRRTCWIRNLFPKSLDTSEKLTLRQAFGLPVIGPDEQCRMHRQQSVISELTEQMALMYFVALERLASQVRFKPFKSFKQFKSLTLLVQSYNFSSALKRNLSQRRPPFAQDLRFVRGDEHRLTAQ